MARRLSRFSVLRLIALASIYGLFLGAGGAYWVYAQLARELPERLDKVLDYRPARATRVYSADGELIGEFFLQKRVLVPLDRIPLHVQNAFVATEDRRFRKHVGFDPIGIARASYENYVKGGIRQGASTITQQVTRMLMLTQERTLTRKLKELILSVRVERELTKDQILYIYLNHVYLGHGAYGVQAAAEEYFGKDAQELTVAEAAILAGLPKAPTKFSPYNDYARARERQQYVLARMAEDGYITPAQEEAARKEPLALLSREQPLNHVAAPYFVDFIRHWASERYGDRSLFDGGLRIQTTIDMKKQRVAESALRRGLEDLDRRLGFRGPIGHLDGTERDAFASGPPRPYVISTEQAGLYAGGALLPGVPYVGLVVDLNPKKRLVSVDVGPRTVKLAEDDAGRALRWRDKKKILAKGDLVPVIVTSDEKKGDLAQIAEIPDVQAALVSVDPKTGDIVSMVGGYDYARSVFNRAVQAKRQAGSSMKPFIYATALQHGFTELSIVQDAPIAVKTATGIWAPHNYESGKFLGFITLKTALANSINTVSVRLVVALGVDPVIKTMRTLGITTDIPRHVSIALGTPDVSLLQMVCAYASFPAGGAKVTPRFVTEVSDDDGGRAGIIDDWRKPEPRVQALPPEIAYLMVDLMRGVVQRGTARKAQELGRPAAGKTGTSTNFRDAWFIGYTTDLITGVWVGRDDFKPIGYNTTGGTTALPIWLEYMRAAHPDTPVRDFTPPADVTFVRANEMSGEPAPAGASSASWVPFARGTVPARFTSEVDANQFSTSIGFGAR